MRRQKRRPWTPFRLAQAYNRRILEDPELAKAVAEQMGGCKTWMNSRYIVTEHRYESPVGTIVHLSIHDIHRTANRDFRDFQRIKNELIGTEEEAVEIYPAESRLVDTSNEWNLFCVLGKRIPFGYETRLVSEKGDDIGAVQRPWEDDNRPPDLVYITRQMVLDGRRSK